MQSIVLVDDHPLLLRGLQDILGKAVDFKVVGAGTNGAEATSLIQALRPDIAVLDIAMPKLDGLCVLRSLRSQRQRPKMIFLTATISGAQIADALALGVWGILLKEYAPDALLDCLRQVAAGKRWLPDDLVARAKAKPETNVVQKFSRLTARELEIAALVCQGLSNRAIAQQLGASEGTIRIHLHNIFRKMELANRTALAALHVQYIATNSS